MIPTWGTSSGRNGAGGIPSLLLDFSNQSYLLNGTGYAAFGGSPGITFSRGTNATLVDSTGQLTFAPSNMLINSDGFGSTNWVIGGTTSVSSNTTVAPDETTTADAVTIPSASSIRQVFSSPLVGVNYSVSVWARADAPQTLRLVSNTSNSVIVSTLCSVTTAWQRFSLVRVCPIGATSVSIQIDTSGGGTAGTYYLWGAQLGAVTYETSPRGYNSTTPKNLLGFTEEFNNAAWAKTLATVTPNSIADPNGNLNADTLSATVGNATILQTLTLLAVPYTFSIWLKRKTGTGNINITINGVTFVTQAVTADWARFSTTLTPSAGTKNIGVQIVTLGDEVYAWGAQLSDSASVDPYVYNPAAAPTSTAYYGPRFDYDPVTLAPLGLLIEEARTNLLLNSAILSTQNITTTAQAYTLSFYGTGTVTLSGTSTAGPLVGTGVFPNRVSLTFTPTAGTLTLTVSGTVSNAQLEAGGFATSYIPTAGASVTRSADIATMVGNNFTNWYNQTNGTISVSTDTVAPNGANIPILSFQDAAGASTNRHQLSFYTLCSATVLSNTVQANLGANTLQSLKSAYAYQDNNFGFSANGTTTVVDPSGTVPLSIGYATLGRWDYGATPLLNGHLKTISYYNGRLTDAQIQALTA